MRTKVLFSGLISMLLLIVINYMGCLDGPTDEDSALVQITGFTSMTPGATKQIQGTIEASPAIDETAITIEITKDGANVISNFTIAKNDITESENINLEDDLGLKITPSSSIANGTYVLTISAEAGTFTGSDNVTFSITGTTPDLVVHDVTLGSWQNTTYGSSLEADSMVVYKNTPAAAISADIDIWYSNEADGSNAFYSPAQAATILHPPKDWATKNQTQMAIVAVTFENITKQTQVDSIWATVAAGDKKQLLRPTANQVFVLETDKGNARLVKFLSGDGTNAGTALIKGKK